MPELERHDVILEGCAPQPLAHYLKALGLLRLVAKQADPGARGWWQGDRFVLRSRLDSESLIRFLAEAYHPTPIIAPWNGGSGFWPKDNATALQAILQSASERLAAYREAIRMAKEIIQSGGWTEKPNDGKESILRLFRSRLPESSLEWLDAAYVLTSSGPKYPPLLGTGGNDGRLDFTNNFMQRLLDILDPETGKATLNAGPWLQQALSGKPIDGLQAGSAIGQFHPGAAGGANGSTGFGADSLINPWDYILMIEGSLLFAGASVKRLESGMPDAMAFPFCARAAGIGYGSASLQDESDSRAEMWMPLWGNPCTYAELSTLFGEGRAQVNGRAAGTGVDFARAIASLGVDRGIKAFQRYGFLMRNGRTYFATPLKRLPVTPNAHVSLLDELDGWLVRSRRTALDKEAPASIQRAYRQLESAILELCQASSPHAIQRTLEALGKLDRSLMRSFKWATKTDFPPLPPLSMRWWQEANDGSAEFRLASSLASLTHPQWGPIRSWTTPVTLSQREDEPIAYFSKQSDPLMRWEGSDFSEKLARLLQQRLLRSRMDGHEPMSGRGRHLARLDDVALFLNEEIDDQKLEGLFHGLSLLAWKEARLESGELECLPNATYATLKLCHHPGLPTPPEIVRLLLAGRGNDAIAIATRRLKASLGEPKLGVAHLTPIAAKRLAASLMFPLSEAQIRRLRQLALFSQDIDLEVAR